MKIDYSFFENAGNLLFGYERVFFKSTSRSTYELETEKFEE